jgi:hypothetical protein
VTLHPPKRKKPHRKACTRRAFCTRLDERLNPEANHGKGLTMLYLTNLKTGKGIRLGVMHKLSESDRGLVLSFCPWCGTNLLELFHLAGSVEPSGPKVDEDHAP